MKRSDTGSDARRLPWVWPLCLALGPGSCAWPLGRAFGACRSAVSSTLPPSTIARAPEKGDRCEWAVQAELQDKRTRFLKQEKRGKEAGLLTSSARPVPAGLGLAGFGRCCGAPCNGATPGKRGKRCHDNGRYYDASRHCALRTGSMGSARLRICCARDSCSIRYPDGIPCSGLVAPSPVAASPVAAPLIGADSHSQQVVVERRQGCRERQSLFRCCCWYKAQKSWRDPTLCCVCPVGSNGLHSLCISALPGQGASRKAHRSWVRFIVIVA